MTAIIIMKLQPQKQFRPPIENKDYEKFLKTGTAKSEVDCKTYKK